MLYIMFTHLGEDQRSIKDAKELGAYAYFLKPFNMEDIDKCIEEIKDKFPLMGRQKDE